jgi:hypothetical protein
LNEPRRIFMTDDVRQATPPDEEMTEYWERLPDDEEHLRGVEVAAIPAVDGWQATIWAREYFRDDPLGRELKQRLDHALRSVHGVTGAENQSWETRDVSGTPSGEALCRAAAAVLDELADRLRTDYREMFGE